MALSTAVYSLLYANASLKGVVATRIYPGLAAMNTTLPCVVYDVGDITPDYNVTSDLNWDRVAVSVTVIALEYSDCETYAGYVRTALSRYKGVKETENIDTIIFEGMTSGYDPEFTYSGATTGVGVFTRTCNFTLIRKA